MKDESLLRRLLRNLRASGALAYYIGVLPMLRIPTLLLISIVLSILPPVFYPIGTLPAILRPVAELIPTTHSANLIRSVMGMPPGGVGILVSWLALPAFTLAFLSLALLKAKWREP